MHNQKLRTSRITKVTSLSRWHLPCTLVAEFMSQETIVSKLWRNSFRSCALFISVLGFGAFVHGDDGRKIKSKVSPQYPELARKMNVSGAVKLELVVAANGQVKSVKPLGGHPLLIDAAENAVKQWRYEPGVERTEVVEIRFANGN
jgi:TonB family protein